MAFGYYPDDTTETVTDARGAKMTSEYNAHWLLTFVEHYAGQMNPVVDRAYAYDFAGRLMDAFTGSEACAWVQTNDASTGAVIDGPYRQSYAFDQWCGMQTLETRSFTGTRQWQQTVAYPLSNLTRRNTSWIYDATGRVAFGIGRNPNHLFNRVTRGDLSYETSLGALTNYNKYRTFEVHSGAAQNIEFFSWNIELHVVGQVCSTHLSQRRGYDPSDNHRALT